MPFFDISETEHRSFNSVVRHTILNGPLALARFSDSSRHHEGMKGSFWMYASEVEEILRGVGGNGPYGLQLVRTLSERWAICDDWGDLQRVWVMNIPRDQELHAYFGFAKFQPKISSSTQRRSGRRVTSYYEGGSLQLVVRVGEREARWISGPYRSLDFSLSKLKNAVR